MIRQSRKVKTTTIKTTDDRFVTDSVTFDNTYPCKHVGVMVPSPDAVSGVVLQVAQREHRYNYPCMPGLSTNDIKNGRFSKPKPEGKHGYAANGIMLEWDMDDVDGTTIKDKVQGLILTEAGDPTYQQSAATPGLGHGIAYDGTGDLHSLTLSSSTVTAPYTLPETGDFSVECVFATSDGTSGAADCLVSCRNGAAGIGWAMLFDAADHVDFHVDDTTEVVLEGQTDVDTGTIQHVIASLDRDGYGRLYVNGVAETGNGAKAITTATGTLLYESATTKLSVGCDAAGTGLFIGNIYFVRVYNYALSATEAMDNYRTLLNQGAPGWVNFVDPAWQDGGDLCAAGEQPVYTDLSRVKSLNNLAFRARHLVEQTATNDLKVYWIFE